MNHLHPPFNNVKVRQAVLMALSQEDYMRAVVGDDDSLWKPLPGFFTPGTPLYTEVGGDILKGRATSTRAKKLLAESGYTDQPVTCLVAQDQPITKTHGRRHRRPAQAARHECRFRRDRLGHRRASAAHRRTPPGQGGWGMFHTWHAGADCVNPASYNAVRGTGDKAWFGWPDSPEVEKEIDGWFDAKNARGREGGDGPAQQGRAWKTSSTAPTGFFLALHRPGAATSCRASRRRPLPFFWGVSKA